MEETLPENIEHMHNGHYWGFHWIWLTIGFVAIILILSVLMKNRRQPTENESPMDILKRRFAVGEIDEEEFERKKEALKKD